MAICESTLSLGLMVTEQQSDPLHHINIVQPHTKDQYIWRHAVQITLRYVITHT